MIDSAHCQTRYLILKTRLQSVICRRSVLVNNSQLQGSNSTLLVGWPHRVTKVRLIGCLKYPERFLKRLRHFNGATGAFESDFNFVQQVLESSGATARATRDIASEQLVGIEGTISQLEALNEESQKIIKSLNSGFKDVTDGVMSVEQATAELAEAQSDFDDAQAAVDKAIRDNGGFINDVKSATNAVETAVRELGRAILQGFGNAFVRDQQIRDFVIANPNQPDSFFANAAIKDGLSGSQVTRALQPLNVSPERVNRAFKAIQLEMTR